MNDRTDAARGAIAHRWPALAKALAAVAPLPLRLDRSGPVAAPVVEGIHLASGYDPPAEAAHQASLIPDGAREAWIYGVGNGELPRLLLGRPHLERLHAVLLNPALFAATLPHLAHTDWLADPRLTLTVAGPETRLHTPFCAVPPCLRLAADPAAALRDRVQLELDSAFLNRRYQRELELTGRIEANLPYLAQDGDVAELFGSRPGSAVTVVGAGPTLDRCYGFLALPQLIVVVDRALRLLLERGCAPHYVLAIDPHESVEQYLDHPPERLRHTTLIYAPTIPPAALARWPGPRLAAYSDSDLFAAAAARYPKGRLFRAGSVIHPAVDLAVRMGARLVLLAGTDFGFPFGKAHANGTMVAPQQPQHPDAGAWVHDWSGNRLPTLPNLRGYLRDLEEYLARHREVRFLVLGRSGARIAGAHAIPLPPERGA